MKLKTSLNGKSYEFKSITEVLAKANEPKSADRFQGIAAETASERVAAKVVLSELTVEDLTENPTIPYEEDEVTRVNIDGLNRPMYERFKGMTIGELREWILDHKTSREELCRASRAFTGEVVAAVAKIMSAMDLVYGASKIVRPRRWTRMHAPAARSASPRSACRGPCLSAARPTAPPMMCPASSWASWRA